jgi:hypothetical protein
VQKWIKFEQCTAILDKRDSNFSWITQSLPAASWKNKEISYIKTVSDHTSAEPQTLGYCDSQLGCKTSNLEIRGYRLIFFRRRIKTQTT